MAELKPGRSGVVRHVRPLVVVQLHANQRVDQQIGHTIASYAHRFDWDLLDLRFTRGALPEGRPLAGALVHCLPTAELAARLRSMGCPMVRIGRLPHPQDELMPAVLPDVGAIGRLAAEHFAERGFRDVAYVGHDPWSLSQAVFEAFRERAEALACRCHLLRLTGHAEQALESGELKYEHRAREVGEWLASLSKPLGLLAYTDVMAASLCTMCERAGLTVPEDVAVLGVGNHLLECEMAPVSLSSVDYGRCDLAREAALLLKHLMQGAEAPATPLLVPPRGVVIRRSTDVLAVDDPNVAKAMRFLWDHLEQDISVDICAAEVGVPRRKLERAFRRHLGRGVNAELQRRRLERCCELLRSTKITIADLAPMIGFHSGDYLHACFKRHFGMTPRQYRVSKG